MWTRRLVLGVALGLAACRAMAPVPEGAGVAAELPEVSATPTATPTATSTASATRTWTRTPTRTATRSPTPTPTSRWYGADMALRLAMNVALCPVLPYGCFGEPPECLVDLCYCPALCEPHLWLPAPGHTDTASGVMAGRGHPCLCRAD